MGIRWRKDDEETLRKKVRNYNAKIDRLEKKGFDKERLPEKIKYKELRKEITTRRQLKTELDLMNALLKRGSERNKVHTSRGADISFFEYRQSKIKIREINYTRREQMKKYKDLVTTDRGMPISQKNNFTDELLASLEPKAFNFENMSRKDFQKYKESLGEYKVSIDKKNQLYRENSYIALEHVFGQKSKDIIDILEGISTEVIIEQLYRDVNLNIDFYYEQTEQEGLFQAIIEGWNRIYVREKNKGTNLK